MTYVKIVGFAPDKESTLSGVLPEVKNALPTHRGMRAINSTENEGVNTASASVVGAASIAQLDGSVRTFHGTAAKLYENVSGTWTDVSRGTTGAAEGTASGSSTAYTTATNWRFDQVGNETIAVSKENTAQASVTGAFADLTGAPLASIVAVVDRQAILFDVNDGVDDQGDRWRTSAQDDVHDWTTAPATLAASGRLVDTPGSILGGKRLGRDVVAYKDMSIYLGRFVGPPVVVDFDLVSAEVGAPSHEAVVSIENLGHLFPGRADFYLFNGSSLDHIGDDNISEWFFDTELDTANRSKILGVHDPVQAQVIWWYPSVSGGGDLDKWIAYNYHSKKWGHGEKTINWVFNATFDSSITYGTIGSLYSTYGDLPAIPYDSSFWISVNSRIAAFTQGGVLQSFSGKGESMEITTFDYGNDSQFSFVDRLRPRFGTFPESGKYIHAYRNDLGESLTTSSSTSVLNEGKFDFEREARWHRGKMILESRTGSACEVLGLDLTVQAAGSE